MRKEKHEKFHVLFPTPRRRRAASEKCLSPPLLSLYLRLFSLSTLRRQINASITRTGTQARQGGPCGESCAGRRRESMVVHRKMLSIDPLSLFLFLSGRFYEAVSVSINQRLEQGRCFAPRMTCAIGAREQGRWRGEKPRMESERRRVFFSFLLSRPRP